MHGSFEPRGELGVDGIEFGAQAGGAEAGPQTRERIGGLDGGVFRRGEVIARIVGGVAAQAGHVGLDQEGAAGGAGAVDGGGETAGGGQRVGGKIEREALDAVAGGAVPEFQTGGELFADGRGVGVTVVFNDEDHGQAEECGEVHRLVHVAGGRGAVSEDGEADGRLTGAALGVGRADDVGEHGAEVGDHRQRPVGGVAVVDVALAGEGGAAGVGKILIEVVAEVAAPDEMAAEAPVGKGDYVGVFVGEQGEGHAEGLVALAAGDGAFDQPLAKEVQDTIVGQATERGPGVVGKHAGGRGFGCQVGGVQGAHGQAGWGRGRRRKHGQVGNAWARRRLGNGYCWAGGCGRGLSGDVGLSEHPEAMVGQ